jgi:TusA-related sulfurtransferase
MTTTFLDVDVRPIMRAGGEPFGKIMEAMQSLKPAQGLRLFATFKPVPLFGVMGQRGFTHEARELEGGEWEVLFHPTQVDEADKAPEPKPTTAETAWPEPAKHLDNRDLDPPEPMVRILAAIETMSEGEVLSALLCREPVFLFPELAKRNHQWRGGFEADGSTYKVLVRINCAQGATR